MTVSLIGDGIYFVAIAWEALRLSNTTIAISLVGIAWMLPTIVFLVLGGAVSDRVDRRRLLLCAAFIQAVAIGAIGVLVTVGGVELGVILVPVAVYGAANAFFLPAFEAIVPMIVSPGELTQVSAIEQFMRPLALQLAGPAIGGVLIALAGTGTAFLVDAGSFLAPVGALIAIRIPRRCSRREADERGSLTGIADAMRFVRANSWLWRTLLAAALTMFLFVGPFQVLLPYVVKNGLHAGSGTLGAIRACGGAGALVGALAVGQRGVSGWPVRAMLVGWSLQCLTLAGYALAMNAWLFGAISLIGGAFGAGANVVWGTLIKTRVPNHMLGRVASLDWLTSLGLVPVSYAITGPVAAALGATTTLLGAGVLAAATMLGFALASRSRSCRESVVLRPSPAGPWTRLQLRAAGDPAVGGASVPVLAAPPVMRSVGD
jgi:MFS family permease